MSNPTEIEAALFLLKDFLEREKERERKGVTIEKVYEQNEGLHRKVDAVERQQQLIIRDQIAQGMRIDRYGKRLRKVEKKVFNEEEDAANDEETTGNYRVIEVQRAAEIAELRRRADAVEAEKKKEAEERQWWTRWGWKLVAGILLAFFGATCTTGGGVAAYYLTKGALHP